MMGGWIYLLLPALGLVVLHGATNRLYQNNRDGTFTDVTEKAGLHSVGWACGVCIGDYNNDGFDDIFCSNFGQNTLYRNNGDGNFHRWDQGGGAFGTTAQVGRRLHLRDYDRERPAGPLRFSLRCAFPLKMLRFPAKTPL